MRILIILIFLFVFASSGFGQSTAMQSWSKFTPPAGHFTVSFPIAQEPKAEIATTPDAKIGAYTTYLYSLTSDATMYMVGWVDYAATFHFDTQREIGQNRDNFVKGLQAKVISERPMNFGAAQGIEFVAESDSSNVSATSRVVVVGQRPIMLIVVGRKGRDISANVERFFSSFSLRGQPRTVWSNK